MKRYFLLLIFIFPLLLAQEASAQKVHFDGVAIRGDAMSFVGKLREKGWTASEARDHVVVLTGTWNGYDNVTLTVLEDEDGKRVTDLGVLVSCQADWVNITTTWQSVVDLLSADWGRPNQTVTRFNARGAMDEATKLILIQRGKCDWKAFWELRNAEVVTSVAFVQYGYYVLTTISLKR